MKVALAPYTRPVQSIQDLAWVCGEGCEDFWTRAAHAHQSDRGFWIRLCLVLEYEVYAVGLSIPAGGDVVAVPAALAVVDPGRRQYMVWVAGWCEAYTIMVASNPIFAVAKQSRQFPDVRAVCAGGKDEAVELRR